MEEVKQRSFDHPVTEAIWSQWHHFWQLPLMMQTFWWNAWVDTLWSRPPLGHHVPHHDEHDQLDVPEPIETEGECLFA